MNNLERTFTIDQIREKLDNLLPWQLTYFLNRIAEAEAIALMPPAKCRSCGASILWGKTETGKACPFDEATGESHFKTCPDAKKWSKLKHSPSASIMGQCQCSACVQQK